MASLKTNQMTPAAPESPRSIPSLAVTLAASMTAGVVYNRAEEHGGSQQVGSRGRRIDPGRRRMVSFGSQQPSEAAGGGVEVHRRQGRELQRRPREAGQGACSK